MASSSASITTPLRTALSRRRQAAPSRLISTVRRVLADQASLTARLDPAASSRRRGRGAVAEPRRSDAIPVIAVAAAMTAARRQTPGDDPASATRDIARF